MKAKVASKSSNC